MTTLQEAPRFRTIDQLIAYACTQHASDIHLTPARDHFQVRFRINGLLGQVCELSTDTGRSLVQAFKAESKMNIAETRRSQDARLSRQDTHLRLATHPSLHGENMVIRLMNSRRHLGITQLGLNKAVLDMLNMLLTHESGLLLVAGATGSGKTTLLHALLNSLGEEAGRITTLEDPVEIINPLALQTDLSRLPHLTFASGLRSLMRQDPDTILVGEIRDEETAELTLNAALTGHRVFASVHAPDCLGAVSRLIELNVRLGSLLNCLNGIVTLRLKPCGQNLQQKSSAEILNLKRMQRQAVLGCDGISQILKLCTPDSYLPFEFSTGELNP